MREQAGKNSSLASSMRAMPTAPAYSDLPDKRLCSARASAELCQIQVTLKVVTPILGGAARTRAIDEVDIIRVPSVRGHLRFWWRALYGHRYACATGLYADEARTWGQAAKNDGGRSPVEARVEVVDVGEVEKGDIRLFSKGGQSATPGAYALWPARASRDKTGAAHRRVGTKFKLTLSCPASLEAEIGNALRAWILFGGYGSRTRRGLGSLAVLEDAASWMPVRPSREAIVELFDIDIFASPESGARDTPLLAGASMHVLEAGCDDAQAAWCKALEWLKEFRQGTSGGKGNRAREPGDGLQQINRPSISNWPEADKIRHLKGKTMSHPPRHNARPAWPRASFGLPIVGQFQTSARNGKSNSYDEPGAFELRWRTRKTEHSRLGSPLIVKALPLANGTFVPCALWLNRAYPENGEVGLVRQKKGGRRNEKEVDPNTVAPFDRLVAEGDDAQFSAIANKQGLRQAFLTWLHNKYKTTEVAP